MRTSLKVALGGVGLLALASYASGIGPSYIRDAPAMLTGMGAMVTCTQHYVSGLSTAQAESDLQSYAAAFESVDLTYDDTARRVEASFFGVKTTSAQYREGLGCALEIGDTSALTAAVMPVSTVVKDVFWPQGGSVPEASPSMQALLNKILKSDNAAGLQTRALLVVKNGVVMAEAYSEGLDPSSKLLGWSMSKSFNALLVGNLEMRGLLDPAQKPLFTEWAEDARADISLDDMLHMASGLDLPEIYQPGTAVTSMLFTSHDSTEVGLGVELVAAPGTRYQYSSGSSNLLSQIIQDKVGGSFQHSLDNLHTEFVQPMGMQNFAYATDPSGLFMGSSFVTASARDWARIGQLMLNGGKLNGHRFVTEDWVARAVAPNNTENRKSYGYQFWLNRGGPEKRWADLPVDAYAARGSRDQSVMIIPSEDMVIVRLGWSKDGQYPLSQTVAQVIGATKKAISAEF